MDLRDVEWEVEGKENDCERLDDLEFLLSRFCLRRGVYGKRGPTQSGSGLALKSASISGELHFHHQH